MSEAKWTASHMRISPSKINTYLKCPREFYYNYIAKLPQKKTVHLFRGTLVHQILEDLFKKQFKLYLLNHTRVVMKLTVNFAPIIVWRGLLCFTSFI